MVELTPAWQNESFNLCFKVKVHSSVEVLFICYDLELLNAFMSLVLNNMYSDLRFPYLLIIHEPNLLAVNTYESTDILIILFIFNAFTFFFSLILPPHICQMSESGVEFNGMICRQLSGKG